MDNSSPDEIKLTRMGAADLMRHCTTPPADAGNCLSCIACDNCSGYYNKIAEILDDPLGTCWVSVEERLPRNDVDVLVVFGESNCKPRVTFAHYYDDIWFDCIYACDLTSVTHWMYLPNPPRNGDRKRPVVSLDCKIGDIVYAIIDGKIVPMEVTYIYINRNKVRYHAAEAVYEKNFRKPGIGKDVFLTREDAEAALAEDNNVPGK